MLFHYFNYVTLVLKCRERMASESPKLKFKTAENSAVYVLLDEEKSIREIH